MSFEGLPRSPSYYDLLGVSIDADPTALKKAYRFAAFEHHPDRGGSHAEMVKLNAAYLVLSSAPTRAAYDAWLVADQDEAGDEAIWERTREARANAQEYPEGWPEFAEWLEQLGEAVAKDWGNAEFKASIESVPFNHHMGPGGVHFPDPGDSVTGWASVLLGGVLGLAQGIGLLSAFPDEGFLSGFFRFLMIPLLVLPSWVGAWVGLGLHQLVGLLATAVEESKDQDGSAHLPGTAGSGASAAEAEEPTRAEAAPSTSKLSDIQPVDAITTGESDVSETPGCLAAVFAVGRTIEAAVHLNARIADSTVSLLYFRLPTEENLAERVSTQEPYPDGCIIPFMTVNTIGAMLFGLALLDGC